MNRRLFYAFSLTLLVSLEFLQAHPGTIMMLSDQKAADFTESQTRLEQLGQEIKREIGVPKASKASQCKLIALGSKPCGGPWSYEVYSTETSNDFRLKGLVSRYNNLERTLNEEQKILSTCDFVQKPQVTFSQGICRIKRS